MYARSKRHPHLYRKGSSVWWAFIPNPAGGRKLRETTRLTDEGAAHDWYLRRIRESGTGGAVQAAGKERALGVALDTRIAWLKSARKHDDPTRKKLAADTIDFYVKKSRALMHVLGRDTLLSAIGHETIRSYIVKRSRTAKATTIAKELTTLSMAMRLAKKDGVRCADFRDIVPEDFAANYVPKQRWLPESEVDALIEDLPTKRAAVVAFIVATSATYPSEVDPFRASMIVDRKRYDVRIPGKKRKTRDRVLRVPSHARKYFDFAMKHMGAAGFEPWSNIRGDLHDAAARLSRCKRCRDEARAWARHEDGATKPRAKEDCAACKVAPVFPALSPNDLRRTFVQWLVRSGVPNELVGPMAGHAPGSKMVATVYGERDSTSVGDLVELALRRAPKGARKAG